MHHAKKFTIISADLMIPEKKDTVVAIIKGSAQLFKLYPKLSSMCNHGSYNLNHYDHVQF